MFLIDEYLDTGISKYIDVFVEADFSRTVEEQFNKIRDSLGNFGNAKALTYIEPLVEWASFFLSELVFLTCQPKTWFMLEISFL